MSISNKKTVADVMSAPVISVTMDTSFADIRELMEELKIHHFPVIDKDELTGIISDRDLLRILSPHLGTVAEMQRDVESSDKVAHQIMTRQPICVKATDPVDVVLAWLQSVDISCVLVTGEANELLGIVTWRDLLKYAKFQ